MKIMRVKFKKEGDMIYISHLDLQRTLQRAFRRAEIQLCYSQGFNPHPKMSYGNALALGTESQGEYVDIEVEDDLTEKEFLEKIAPELPVGLEFVKCKEIDKTVPALSSVIEWGEYLFTIPLERKLSKEFVKAKVLDFMGKEEIIITKKNKKGKLVEVDIRPLIKTFDVLDLEDNSLTLNAVIATGSIQNLNTNLFIPQILSLFGIELDPLDVDILRRDLYYVEDGELVTPL